MEFSIDPSSRLAIWQQLAHQVREGIARGKLRPGDRLPSVRELSRAVVVNPNTIARVYTELEREGIIDTRPGLGAFIAEPSVEQSQKVRKKRLQEASDHFLTEAVHLGFTAEEVVDLVTKQVKQFKWSEKE
ncbi:MAG: GntR family transcriptional regulator [Planctomycetia bacterium]|jgi:GntR family transcriptional regulator